MSSNQTESNSRPPLDAGRFVWLHHEMPTHAARSSHWDLMLETSRDLRTWAFSCDLTIQATSAGDLEGTALELPDHRRIYLDYEGPVSGDRGVVVRMDAGDYAARRDSPRSQWVIQLRGSRLCGTLKIEDPSATNVCRWRWSPTSESSQRPS